jgi:predicted acyl esterase
LYNVCPIRRTDKSNKVATKIRDAIVALIALLAATSCREQTPPFDKIEAMIAMRDGVRLNTEIYAPKNARERLPLLLLEAEQFVMRSDPAGIGESQGQNRIGAAVFSWSRRGFSNR